MVLDAATQAAQARLRAINSGNYNEETNPGGMAAGGHRTNFPAACTDLANVAEATANEADAAAAARTGAEAAQVAAEAAAANTAADVSDTLDAKVTAAQDAQTGAETAQAAAEAAQTDAEAAQANAAQAAATAVNDVADQLDAKLVTAQGHVDAAQGHATDAEASATAAQTAANTAAADVTAALEGHVTDAQAAQAGAEAAELAAVDAQTAAELAAQIAASKRAWMPTYLIRPADLRTGKDYYGAGCRPAQFTPWNGSSIWMNEAGEKVIGLPGWAYDHGYSMGKYETTCYHRYEVQLHKGTLTSLKAIACRLIEAPGSDLTVRLASSDGTVLATTTIAAANIPLLSAVGCAYDPFEVLSADLNLTYTGLYYVEYVITYVSSVDQYAVLGTNLTPNYTDAWQSHLYRWNPTSQDWTDGGAYSPAVQFVYAIDADNPCGWAFAGIGSDAAANAAYTNIDASVLGIGSAGMFVVDMAPWTGWGGVTVLMRPVNKANSTMLQLSVGPDDRVRLESMFDYAFESSDWYTYTGDVHAQHQWAMVYGSDEDDQFYARLYIDGELLIDHTFTTQVDVNFDVDLITLGQYSIAGDVAYYAVGEVKQFAYWPYDASAILPELVGNHIRDIVGQPVHRRYVQQLHIDGCAGAADATSGLVETWHRFPRSIYMFVLPSQSVSVQSHFTLRHPFNVQGNYTHHSLVSNLEIGNDTYTHTSHKWHPDAGTAMHERGFVVSKTFDLCGQFCIYNNMYITDIANSCIFDLPAVRRGQIEATVM